MRLCQTLHDRTIPELGVFFVPITVPEVMP